MAAFVLGNYGNSKEEAMYPTAIPLTPKVSRWWEPTVTRCGLHRASLPPVNAFWSLTMYGLPRTCWWLIPSTAT